MNNSLRVLYTTAVLGLITTLMTVLCGCAFDPADECCEVDENGVIVNPETCCPDDIDPSEETSIQQPDSSMPQLETQQMRMKKGGSDEPDPQPW